MPTKPVVVTVKLLVDRTGVVQKADVQTPPQPPFDQAVVAAARAFRFAPARYGGAPVPVEITFTHTFLPPPPPVAVAPPDQGPPRVSILRGKLVELGTRAPVTGATVTAVVGDRHYAVDADARGRFRLPLPAGPAKILVNAPSHNPFVQQETLSPAQELAVTYFVERDRYDPYEIVVVGDQRREEVSRITLRGPELQQIPGTFGDPFRVVQTLPGVAAVASLLPFPIVRGASPSSTGFLLDGTRVPLLYHLLSGPSVIHPEFIDEIQFYPGGAPVPYGGYTGGIIDGRTKRARPDEHLLDFDANLLQVGGFVRQPVKPLGITLTAAGRYGYPGFLLGLATDRLSLSYWDYQLRARRRQRARRVDGVLLRRARRARHRRRHRRPQRPQSAADAAARAGVSSARSTVAPHVRRAGGVVPRGARLRPHVQHGDRFFGMGRRADAGAALDAERPAQLLRRIAGQLPRRQPGRAARWPPPIRCR